MNKQTKIFAAFTGFVAVILSLAYFNRSPRIEEDVDYWLKMQSIQVNENTPFMVDENQRLDKAQTIDGTMIYTFTLINAVKAESDIELFAKEMIAHLYLTACPNKGVHEFFGKGIDLEYRFLDKNSENILTTTLTKEVCANNA